MTTSPAAPTNHVLSRITQVRLPDALFDHLSARARQRGIALSSEIRRELRRAYARDLVDELLADGVPEEVAWERAWERTDELMGGDVR